MQSNYDNIFTKEEIAEIEKIIGYNFEDKRILCKAFVHSSLAKEKGVASNERLEFFGDRILNFLVSEELFFSVGGNEGVLKEELESRVSAAPLYDVIEKLDLYKFVKHSKNVEFEEKKISDLFEALLAAIYIDSRSFEPCKKLIKQIVPSKEENYIGKLKEYCEKNKIEMSKTDCSDGASFECTVTVGNKRFSGTGKRKKTAEKEACKRACEELNIL